MKLQVKHGKIRWYWVLKAPNGEVVAVSQHYYSKTNAVRAAQRLRTYLIEPGAIEVQ